VSAASGRRGRSVVRARSLTSASCPPGSARVSASTRTRGRWTNSCDEQGEAGASRPRHGPRYTATSAMHSSAGAFRTPQRSTNVSKRRRHALPPAGVELPRWQTPTASVSFGQDVTSRAKVPSDHGRVPFHRASERVVEAGGRRRSCRPAFLLRCGGQDRDSRQGPALRRDIIAKRSVAEEIASSDARIEVDGIDCNAADALSTMGRGAAGHEGTRAADAGNEKEQPLPELGEVAPVFGDMKRICGSRCVGTEGSP